MKRETYELHMRAVHDLLIWEIGEAIEAYVTELEQRVKESSELKAETLRLAEQRAWDAAREIVGYVGDPDNPEVCEDLLYHTFDDWKRRETARELTQEAEELGMYDKE